MPKQRRGTVLILVVMLLFALLAVAGLLIDLGMARLTQAHMQSVADAAAIEGGWELAGGSDAIDIRQSIIQRADEATESWGARRIEFEPGGFDLDDDGVFESALTIDCETYGDPVKPALDANVANAPEGDIVFGVYDANSVSETLPGQPMGYDRGRAFAPSLSDDAKAILVRLRRTGETDLEGGSSAEPLAYLWSRGSLLDLGLKGRGVSVRGESIVQLVPAVRIHSVSNGTPAVLHAAVAFSIVTSHEVEADSDQNEIEFKGIDMMRVEAGTAIGEEANSGEPDVGLGYLPIERAIMLSGEEKHFVVGYMFAEVTRDPTDGKYTVIAKQASELNTTDVFPSANISREVERLCDLCESKSQESCDEIRLFVQEMLKAHQRLQDVNGNFIVRAPRLVRSRQIHSGDSP